MKVTVDDYAHMVYIAQKWRIRAYVVEKLLKHINAIHPHWHEPDLEKEIKIHTDRFFELWKRKEPWHQIAEKEWKTVQ